MEGAGAVELGIRSDDPEPRSRDGRHPFWPNSTHSLVAEIGWGGHGPSMAESDNASRTVLEPPRPLSDSLAIGVLVKHGRAPYLNDPHGVPSYFVTVGTPQG